MDKERNDFAALCRHKRAQIAVKWCLYYTLNAFFCTKMVKLTLWTKCELHMDCCYWLATLPNQCGSESAPRCELLRHIQACRQLELPDHVYSDTRVGYRSTTNGLSTRQENRTCTPSAKRPNPNSATSANIQRKRPKKLCHETYSQQHLSRERRSTVHLHLHEGTMQKQSGDRPECYCMYMHTAWRRDDASSSWLA